MHVYREQVGGKEKKRTIAGKCTKHEEERGKKEKRRSSKDYHDDSYVILCLTDLG